MNIIHMNTMAKASIGLFAALLLVAPAQAAGWSDYTVTAAADSGSMYIQVADLADIASEVVGGTFGGSFYYTTCGGADFNSISFSIATDSGVVEGYGTNGAGVWTWNGLLFVGAASVAPSGMSPGAWTGTASLSLQSDTSDINALQMSLDAFGTAGGTYAHGQC